MIFKTFKAGEILKAQELNDLQEYIGQQVIDKSLDWKFAYGDGADLFGRVKWEKCLDGSFSAILREQFLEIGPQNTAGMPETAELPIVTMGCVELPFDITTITDVAWAFPYEHESGLAQRLLPHMNVKVYRGSPSMLLDIDISGTKALFDSITSTIYLTFDIYINGRWK